MERHAVSYTNAATANVWLDEPPPTMGVREPRKPEPPTLTDGAEAPLEFEPEPEAEGIASGARLT